MNHLNTNVSSLYLQGLEGHQDPAVVSIVDESLMTQESCFSAAAPYLRNVLSFTAGLVIFGGICALLFPQTHVTGIHMLEGGGLALVLTAGSSLMFSKNKIEALRSTLQWYVAGIGSGVILVVVAYALATNSDLNCSGLSCGGSASESSDAKSSDSQAKNARGTPADERDPMKCASAPPIEGASSTVLNASHDDLNFGNPHFQTPLHLQTDSISSQISNTYSNE